jgi:hypothetical protein
MTMDESLTALYSLSGSLRYSINEQPVFDSDVALGMYLSKAGTYTLQLTTTGSDRVWLTDHETGIVVDATEPYDFVVEQSGTLNRRFTLKIGDGITSVETVQGSLFPDHSCYDLQGRRVQNTGKGLYIQNGKKIIKLHPHLINI